MNILLAIISGLLTAVSFPTAFGKFVLPNLGFLAWFSLAPLFYAVYHSKPRQAFFLTFITAFIYYGISLYWLYNAMYFYGGLSGIVSVLLLILVVILQSSYSAVSVMLGAWVDKRAIPIFWAALEFARNYTPCNGFPWGSLTNSQYEYLPLIQCVDVIGVYGLVYIMISLNWGCAGLLRGRYKYFIYSAVLVAVSFSYGVWRMGDVGLQESLLPSRRAALLQANIPQEEKWRLGQEEFQLSQYNKMMQLSGGTNLIIWPESGYPYIVPHDSEKIPLFPPLPATTASAGREKGGKGGFKIGKKVLMGALTKDASNGVLYNSVILTDGEGNILNRYHKMHLVPFGEYVPYKKLLFFADKLTAPVGNFARGTSSQPLDIDGWRLGALICYEDIFPEISRKVVRNGANLLTVVTNDAWYGKSSAAYQHLAISVFRSVETRRAQVRAANTGISAVIDTTGKIITKSEIFTQGIIATGVKISGIESLYVKWGDFFAWACVLTSIVLILLAIRQRRKENDRTIC